MSRANHVVLVGPSHPYRGGIAHYNSRLYGALAATRQVTLMGFTRLYPERWFPGSSQLDNSAIAFEVPAERILDPLNPLSWWRAFRRIQASKAPMIVLHWWHPFFAPCMGSLAHLLRRFSRSKIAYIVHNVLPHESVPGQRLLTRYALTAAHRLIVHSASQRNAVRALAPRAEVVVHAHPVYDQFRRRGITREAARLKLGLDGYVLLFFGYVRRYKGLDYLLRALPEVLAATDATLIVAGEFYDPPEQYHELVRELGIDAAVRFEERYVPNEDVETYMAACDVAVFPYVAGAHSGALQVAFGCERPVICTRAGGLADVVDDGETGLIVEPRSAPALSAALLRFLELRDNVDFAGNIRVATRLLTWEHLADTLSEPMVASLPP